MLIHDQTPPGVAVLQRLKASVSYRYEDIDRGGRVQIITKNQEARAAVHEFLKLQIADHQTGDSGEIARSRSEHIAAELLRGRTATSMLFLSAVKCACW